MKRNYWLVKQEPEAYSWQDFLKEGKTQWTGVRNYQARNNLQAMRRGDHVLFYHSVTEKSVVGIAQVEKEAFPDPTDLNWLAVEFIPLLTLDAPVSLGKIKKETKLQKIPLIRQGRLSVMPLEAKLFHKIVKMSKTNIVNK